MDLVGGIDSNLGELSFKIRADLLDSGLLLLKGLLAGRPLGRPLGDALFGAFLRGAGLLVRRGDRCVSVGLDLGQPRM